MLGACPPHAEARERSRRASATQEELSSGGKFYSVVLVDFPQCHFPP
jgi:hypothetical protein